MQALGLRYLTFAWMMDGEDDEDSVREHRSTSDYLIVTATSFLSSLHKDINIKVTLLRSLGLRQSADPHLRPRIATLAHMFDPSMWTKRG